MHPVKKIPDIHFNYTTAALQISIATDDEPSFKEAI